MKASPKKITTPKRLHRKLLPAVIKFQGYIIWMSIGGDDKCSTQRSVVQSALLRSNGNELVIDCDGALPGAASYVYTISLRRGSPLLFQGKWTAGRGPAEQRSSGTCSCRLYSNGSRLAFVGEWSEGGATQHWIAELSPIELK